MPTSNTIPSTDILFDRILHGGDYNPEQWPEDVWDEDVRLMREARVNVASVPIFGWVHLQPEEETFTFEWLDRVLDRLHAGGVSACLATATASVPAWLDQKYPDVLRVDEHGRKLRHGNRHSFCPNSGNFRRLATGLVRRIAERYRAHPTLRLWHVGNEYGNYCYCETCATAFRAWLLARYGSLEEVNRRWYASFWGHTFTDWSQIEPPIHTGERSMQALLIDYNRFQSQSLLDCFRAEAAVLRDVTPGVPITTNLMGAFEALDYHKWAAEMDVVSWDSYPSKGAAPADMAFAHALMRGLRDGQPWLLMEQTPSQQNWQPQNALKRPGVMRLWSYQAMAHGADSVMYFQWRRSRGAAEKLHGAVVEHEGSSRPRVFQEVAALGRELEALGDRTLGGRVPARVAILFDWENWWTVRHSIGPSVDLRYVDQCRAYYAAFHGQNVAVDVVSPEVDLGRFDIVVAPVLYMVKPGIAEKLEAFVSAGGTFVTTFFSGIADETDLVYLGGYPGPLRRMLGIWAEEIDALTPDQRNLVRFETPLGALSGDYECRLLCDRIHLEGATALARYASDFYAGEPAVTVNQFGKGRAYYVATALEPRALSGLCAAILAEKGVESALPNAPAGVEALPRVSPDGRTLLYVLNHEESTAEIALPAGTHFDLLSGRTLTGRVALAGRDVLILEARAGQ